MVVDLGDCGKDRKGEDWRYWECKLSRDTMGGGRPGAVLKSTATCGESR